MASLYLKLTGNEVFCAIKYENVQNEYQGNFGFFFGTG
jgi:hypothetical protein